MIMNVKMKLWSLVCMVLPGVGFALICIGAYLVPLQTNHHYSLRVILAYVTISCGFLVMLTGVLWVICHSMKSKMYHRGRHDQHVCIYSIDSSYPPSYEESQSNHVHPNRVTDSVVMVYEVGMTMSPLPPLYSQDSSEIPDCTWSWEQPPPYTQTQTDLQGHAAVAADAQAQWSALQRH